ncbi:hypothetical protein [Methylobacterium sp. NEAU K]|uniref:hypothetical protein n=1 Tax=Methylobacterium sp. NEAU K TaxID=3064946 RepID=UPI0027334B22|nr:hypothetical protein [Methylobacterium sp. NEAU K]MDP4004139.1 hypothetical protein [Methylobacterium sp. NEAU K]
MPPIQAIAFLVALAGAGPASALTAEPADPRALEQAWHRCLREAYAHQPTGQSQAGDERNALDQCRAQEDAYVAAVMAAGPAGTDEHPAAWARTWAAYVVYVVDPVKAWIDALRR